MEIDLHGLNVEEATSKIEMALFSFEMNETNNEIIFITGKGSGTINLTFLEIIDNYGNFNYYKLNNRDAYVVTKNINKY